MYAVAMELEAAEISWAGDHLWLGIKVGLGFLHGLA